MLRLDEIFGDTCDCYGAEQAARYITEIFAVLVRIDGDGVASRPIPADFGAEGFCFRHA